jgi:hypothetical protein
MYVFRICVHLFLPLTDRTPIQNQEEEDIYPILIFLKHPSCRNFEAFRELVPTKADPPPPPRIVLLRQSKA